MIISCVLSITSHAGAEWGRGFEGTGESSVVINDQVHGGITDYCRLRILRLGPEGFADYLYVVLFMQLPCRGKTPEDGLGLLFALEAVPNTPAAEAVPDWIIQSFLCSCRVYLYGGSQFSNLQTLVVSVAC